MQRFLGLALAIGVLTACGSSESGGSLTSLTAASTCASGGVTIATGIDDDGDGTLDAEEIDSAETVCNPQTLSRVDVLAVGPECPHGGTAVRWGIDDDGNGLLGDPEIDYSDVTCANAASFDPPTGTPGTATINLSGGDAAGGPGGNGGELGVSLTASNGGHIRLATTGTVDATFTAPARTAVAGANPKTIGPGALNIVEVPGSGDVTGIQDGILYTNAGTLRVKVTGNNTANDPDNPVVTSLTIEDGAVVTFNNNSVNIQDDIVNDGVLTRARAAGAPQTFQLNARSYVGLPGSSITVAGAADQSGGFLTVTTRDYFRNEGTLTADGGDGATGGAAGMVVVNVEQGSAYNLGLMTASGGDLTAATGGGGNSVQLHANGGMVGISGDLIATGGRGASVGGPGGYIYVSADPGDVLVTGKLVSDGGPHAAACSSACRGGSAQNGDDAIHVRSEGGAVRISAGLSAKGAPATSADGCGGGGGRVIVNANENGAFQTPSQGTVELAGTIDLSGGDGGTGAACTGNGGGPGGMLAVLATPVIRRGQEIHLYGYASVTAVGGSGVGSVSVGVSGNGGAVSLYRQPDYRFGEGQIIGGIFNNVPIDVSGANGTGATLGGRGGDIVFSYGSSYVNAARAGADRVVNQAALKANAGSSGTGGDGGMIALHGPEGVTNSGGLEAFGASGNGTAAAAAEEGGDSQGVILSSDFGNVANTAPIGTTGGAGVGDGRDGGDAGLICLEGNHVSNTGALTAIGGAAVGLGLNGDGGAVRITSYAGSSQNTGAVAAGAGTGGTGGVSGYLYLDGQERCWAQKSLVPAKR